MARSGSRPAVRIFSSKGGMPFAWPRMRNCSEILANGLACPFKLSPMVALTADLWCRNSHVGPPLGAAWAGASPGPTSIFDISHRKLLHHLAHLNPMHQ